MSTGKVREIAPIKFGTDGWRAIIAEDYTIENLSRVAEAAAIWLNKNFQEPSAMIGYDCRFNGELFTRCVANIFAHRGIEVFIAPEFVSTPMVSLGVHKRQIDAGFVITASHNPPSYSGFKVKGNYGGPAYPSMIAEIESYIPDVPENYPDHFDAFVEQDRIRYYDMEALYLTHLKDSFDLNLIRNSGIKVGYDAMYGAGQTAFRKALPQATLLHAEFNPSFHGVAPEPIEKNLKEFQALIREKGLEAGIATDGDADRIGMFDENGDFVDSHHLLLLLIHYMHKVKGLNGEVIATFSVTPKVKKLCELYGLPITITKVGFKYIAELMLERNVLVGGEESGGIAIAGHVPERDGIYIGLTILEMMAHSGKKLTELVQEIYDLVGSFFFQRRDLHLSQEQKDSILQQLREQPYTVFGSREVRKTETIDGWKFYFDNDEWVMIRPSGTEPVLRIYAESADRAGAESILDEVIDTLNQPA